MALTRDEFTVAVAGSTVSVTGTTGLVHATWRLLVDGTEVDSAAAAGDFRLRGELPDGSAVEARVHQSLVGPTRVVVVHGGEEVLDAQGFVAWAARSRHPNGQAPERSERRLVTVTARS